MDIPVSDFGSLFGDYKDYIRKTVFEDTVKWSCYLLLHQHLMHFLHKRIFDFWRFETILDLLMLSSNLGVDFQRCLKMQKGTEDIQHSICAWFPLKPMELLVDQSTSIRGKNISSRSVLQAEILTYKCDISHCSASYICSVQMDITQLMWKKW